ncbi:MULTISPECIES: NusG domain II-containing protein [Lachnospiraceae]|jgi:hypothetical protein|uniref:NusG domain II-containing protein n=1 Tax=Faecalicatena acetigenes TaxID=2981790 RepID=A0ABT2T8P9_9FIRM|nr:MULTISPECIES: NusG domain II-containing protein [Lachnospiraceae]MCU6746633.1 NusG domain II-containing protein [Faecalicatena acetigenes]RGT74472.1 NusG domain II-containing protein [Ruminococcus sp. AF18-22]SCH33398.1 Uncharacterized protein conserved in bacteria [uncultured Clostridium sp.]
MKKNDWFLVGMVLLTASGFFLFQFLKPDNENKQVVITVDKELYGIYDLEEEQKIDIEGMNVLEIKEGQVKMQEADCPDLLCVHHKAISKEGESIICLPNKVVVTIRGEEESNVDAMTN